MILRGPSSVIGTHTYDEYVAKHEAVMQMRGLVTVARELPLTPFVDEGRWVADCPHCRAGISLQRDWPDARCLACGSVYLQAAIAWPAAFDAIEALLVVRPMMNQHWHPGETLEQLEAENAAHALPVPERTLEGAVTL